MLWKAKRRCAINANVLTTTADGVCFAFAFLLRNVTIYIMDLPHSISYNMMLNVAKMCCFSSRKFECKNEFGELHIPNN